MTKKAASQSLGGFYILESWKKTTLKKIVKEHVGWEMKTLQKQIVLSESKPSKWSSSSDNKSMGGKNWFQISRTIGLRVKPGFFVVHQHSSWLGPPSVLIWTNPACSGPRCSWSSGCYQDLWELEECSGVSTLGKGTGMGPFSRVGNYRDTKYQKGRITAII